MRRKRVFDQNSVFAHLMFSFYFLILFILSVHCDFEDMNALEKGHLMFYTVIFILSSDSGGIYAHKMSVPPEVGAKDRNT